MQSMVDPSLLVLLESKTMQSMVDPSLLVLWETSAWCMPFSPRFVPRLSPNMNEKYCQQCEAGWGPGNEATSFPQQSKWCNHAPHRGLIELVGGGLGQIMVGKVMNQISRLEMLVFLKFNHS